MSHGYEFGDMDDGVNWEHMVPEVSQHHGMPGQRPRPRVKTEEELALEELEQMNLNGGFIMTFPLPENAARLPGTGSRPRPRPEDRRAGGGGGRAGGTVRSSLEEELRSGPARNPVSGRRVRRARPVVEAGGYCPDCRNPGSKFCPSTGRLHPKPEAPSVQGRAQASATPSAAHRTAAGEAATTTTTTTTRQRSEPRLRVDELVAAQLREEEAEAVELLHVTEADVPLALRSADPPSPAAHTPPPAAARSPSLPPLPPIHTSPPPPRTAPHTATPPHPSTALGFAAAPFATSYTGTQAAQHGTIRTATATQGGGSGGGAGGDGWELSDFSYENLLSLGSMAVCTGLGRAQLAAYKAVPFAGAEEDCSICLCPLEAGEASLEIICSHVFHHSCITTWLAKANRCPVCRFEIPRKEKLKA